MLTASVEVLQQQAQACAQQLQQCQQQAPSLPLAIVAPAALAMLTAIGALWRQVISERKEAQQSARESQVAFSEQIRLEREQSEKEKTELRHLLKDSLRKRAQDSELYLRSLGLRPVTSLPPRGPIR